MDNRSQITQWYRQLSRVTEDDGLDLDALLLDKRHPEDALAALYGLATNLLENGFREEIILLITQCAHPDCHQLVRERALYSLIIACTMFDSQVRLSRDIQDSLLSLLEPVETRLQAWNTLRMIDKAHDAVLFIGGKKTPLRKTLIYHLVVVGEDMQF